MPPIYGHVVDKLRKQNWPRIVPTLTLMDADELGALEALVEQDWTTARVLATWRRQAPGLPMSNWLAQSGLKPGHAAWHQKSFRDLSDLMARQVFGRSLGEIETSRAAGEDSEERPSQ